MTPVNLENYRFAITEPDGETLVPLEAIPYHWRDPKEKPALEGSPIHRLPVEVLREIFIYVPVLEFHQSIFGSTLMPLWLSASQVCSLWRRITLETREFWTYVPLQTRHIHWIELSLERSHPLPISLNINGDLGCFEWYRRALILMTPHAGRAHEIYIGTAGLFPDDQEEFQAEFMEKLGAQPFPFLEILESDDPLASLPSFDGEIPSNLRRIRLSACRRLSQSWIGLRAPLTYLEISECHSIDVLRAIQHLPTLQILILTDAHDTFRPFTPTSPEKIPLPNLRRLEFRHSEYLAFVEFMRYTRIPSDAEIDFLHYDDLFEGSIIDMMTSLTAVFSEHLRESLDAGVFFQNIFINVPQKYLQVRQCAVELSNLSPGSSGRSPSLSGRISCDITAPDSFPSQVRLIPRLLPVFGPIVGKAQTLDAYSSRMLYAREWLDVSCAVGQVTRINVHGSAAQGLVMALVAPAPASAPIFPRLDTLSIEGVTFTDKIDERPVPLDDPQHHMHLILMGHHPVPLPEDSITFIDGLLQALAHRAATGHPVNRLVVANCVISIEMVQSLAIAGRLMVSDGTATWGVSSTESNV